MHPYNNKSLPTLELGASIFVELNKNLWRAAEEFNLTRRDLKENYETGIWDGREIFVSVRNILILMFTAVLICVFIVLRRLVGRHNPSVEIWHPLAQANGKCVRQSLDPSQIPIYSIP